MKKQIICGLVFAGFAFFGNAQTTTIQTTTLTSYGDNAGTLGPSGTYYGKDAGDAVTATGLSNTLIGHQAGKAVSTGDYNVMVGAGTGLIAHSAQSNVFVGEAAGSNTTSGSSNVYIGREAGQKFTGASNTMVGKGAGSLNLTSTTTAGNGNTFLGYYSGADATGSLNVFLGWHAGKGSTGSNTLFIDNSDDTTPLIYGDFATDNLVFNGKVGITEQSLTDQANLFPTNAGGVSVSGYQLFVTGGILTEAVRVMTKNTANWADYVFADGYELATLEEVECFIEENGHLPNVPSAKQVSEEGIELAEMAKVQQEKIEELTLYAIAQDKAIKAQDKAIEEQQQQIEELKAQVKLLLESNNK